MKTKFKDSSPADTIEKIRELLKNLGIVCYEPVWNKTNDFFYTVRIEIMGFPVGANGKGTSRLFALASAYGELMERLQNGFLIPKYYGLKAIPEEKDIPDWEYKNVTQFLLNTFLPNNGYFGTKEELLDKFKQTDSFNLSVPFYNVINNNIENIPIGFISLFCGTNGMSAGNTNEEALVHGISEILERYVIKKVFLEELSLPNIPIEQFKDFPIYYQIKKLEELGYKVFIKDCTLSGTFPVMGVLIVNPDKTKYSFSFGSDPILEIAVERCFTEIFQGIISSKIDANFRPINIINQGKSFYRKREELSKFATNGSGQLPSSVLDYIPYNEDNLSVFYGNRNEYNNQEGVDYLINLIKRNNYKIYIRDLSFLDFPTFKIYIPGMSEIFLKTNDDIDNYLKTTKASKVFLNIHNSNVDDIKLLIDVLVNLNNIKSQSIRKTNTFTTAKLILGVDDLLYNDLEVDFFLCLLNIRIRDYKNAFRYLNDFIKRQIEIGYNIDYFMCALNYLKYKIERKDNDYIRKGLTFMFGYHLAEEVINDLSNEDNIFMNCDLPTCPDCYQCPIKNNCYYNTWYYYNQIMLNKMQNNFKNQNSLKVIFNKMSSMSHII